MRDKKTNQSEKERRKDTRHKTRAFTQAEIGGRQFRLGNLSLSGAFIRTPNPLARGQQVEFFLVGERLEEPIRLSAVVRRSERRVGMGVEFTALNRSERERLEKLLTKIAIARVLIVDGDERVGRVLSAALEQEKYEVQVATTGLEGLYMAVTSQPDIIILELRLRELSGLEVCQQLRASPTLAKIPVVIVSEDANLTEVGTAQQLGAVLFAPKPLKVPTLLSNVRMLLES